MKNNITGYFRKTELGKVFTNLRPGIVLDVGAKNNPYKNKIPHKQYFTLDINPKSRPDYCCDIHKTGLPARQFDTVIATEVLEHLHTPERAVSEIYRILKPGGVCIVSTPAFYHFHPDPEDYYRYTKDSLKYLFWKFKSTEIVPHGNRIHIIWQIISDTFPAVSVFSPLFAKLTKSDGYYPLGFVVVARK